MDRLWREEKGWPVPEAPLQRGTQPAERKLCSSAGRGREGSARSQTPSVPSNPAGSLELASWPPWLGLALTFPPRRPRRGLPPPPRLRPRSPAVKPRRPPRIDEVVACNMLGWAWGQEGGIFWGAGTEAPLFLDYLTAVERMEAEARGGGREREREAAAWRLSAAGTGGTYRLALLFFFFFPGRLAAGKDVIQVQRQPAKLRPVAAAAQKKKKRAREREGKKDSWRLLRTLSKMSGSRGHVGERRPRRRRSTPSPPRPPRGPSLRR